MEFSRKIKVTPSLHGSSVIIVSTKQGHLSSSSEKISPSERRRRFKYGPCSLHVPFNIVLDIDATLTKTVCLLSGKHDFTPE